MNFKNVILVFIIFILSGCISSGEKIAEIYPWPKIEAEWIRDAEPIEFEDEFWYPVDNIENLLDEEMLLMGEYNSVKFFVEKKDIKPYERLYTKFGPHKYRIFERIEDND